MSLFNLIKIEFKKNKAMSYFWSYVVMTIILVFLTWTSIFGVNQDHETSGFAIIKMMSGLIADFYIIFSALVIIKVLNDEYVQRTILLMFTYGIPRKKIIFAKFSLIVMIAVVGQLLTQICCSTFLIGVDRYSGLINGGLTQENTIQWICCVAINTLAIIGYLFIPVTVCIKKKTTSSIVVSAMIGLLIYQMIISQIDNFIVMTIYYLAFAMVTAAFYFVVGGRYIENLEL